MSRSFTGAEITDRAKARSDYKSGSNYTPNTTWLTWLNDANAELRVLLCGAMNSDYFLTGSSLTTTSSVATYNLPSDFAKLRSIDVYEGGKYYEIQVLPQKMRAQVLNSQFQKENIYYRLEGTERLRIYPTPTSAKQINIQYQSSAPILQSLTGSIDGINGYEEIIVDSMAIKQCVKEENFEQADRIEKQRDKRIAKVEDDASRNNLDGTERMVIKNPLWDDWYSYDDWIER